MNFPVQIGWQQVILGLLVIVGVGLLISSILSLVVQIKEVEILEDEEGRRYKRWRRHRKPRVTHGVSGLVLVLLSVALLAITLLAQEYLGLTGEMKVGHVHATTIANMDHMIDVELTLYDEHGKTSFHDSYLLQGDQWILYVNFMELQPWVNILGVHSGYKITGLDGKYTDLKQHPTKPGVVLNGGEGDFFDASAQHQFWTSPFVKSTYGTATYQGPGDWDILVSQDTIKPVSAGS